MAYADLIPDLIMFGADADTMRKYLSDFPAATATEEIYLQQARHFVRLDLFAEWNLDETVDSDVDGFEDRVGKYPDRIKQAIAAKQLELFWGWFQGAPDSLPYRAWRDARSVYAGHKARFGTIGRQRSGKGSISSASIGL